MKQYLIIGLLLITLLPDAAKAQWTFDIVDLYKRQAEGTVYDFLFGPFSLYLRFPVADSYLYVSPGLYVCLLYTSRCV